MVFLFFKQKTAYEMRISDWSSDVCSSDLSGAFCGQASLPRSQRPLRGSSHDGRARFRKRHSYQASDLAQWQGMDGFGQRALSQQVGAAMHAEQGTIIERPIDQAVAPDRKRVE